MECILTTGLNTSKVYIIEENNGLIKIKDNDEYLIFNQDIAIFNYSQYILHLNDQCLIVDENGTLILTNDYIQTYFWHKNKQLYEEFINSINNNLNYDISNFYFTYSYRPFHEIIGNIDKYKILMDKYFEKGLDIIMICTHNYNLNHPSLTNGTILHILLRSYLDNICIEAGGLNIFQCLLSYNPNLEIKDNNGNTALQLAIKLYVKTNFLTWDPYISSLPRLMNAIDLLIYKEANINILDENGNNLLVLCSNEDNIHIILYLIHNNINISNKNTNNKSIYDIAKENNWDWYIDILNRYI